VPLTGKGQEILSSMEKQYGSKEKAEEVLYASKNAGTITGIDAAKDATEEYSAVSTLPDGVTAATINEQNRKYWKQQDPENPENEILS
jgi:hypothetical protein